MKRRLLLAVMALSGYAALGQDVPKVEVPVGFSMVNVHPDFSQITSFNVFGGGGEFDVNFGPYLGIKADFMGYTQSSSLTSKLHALGYTGNVNGNVFTYMFGPQIKKHTGVFQPFGEVLVGAAHSNLYASLYDANNGTTNASSNNNAFAFATGGGLDIKLTPHISARPVQVDYLLTRFGVNGTSYTGSQNNFRYFAGIDFTFGGAPPIPPTASCSVQPTEIMAGDPVTATISTQNFNPKHTVTYNWSSTGGTASGTGTTANLNTANLAPGSYAVTGTATDAKQKKNNTASCSASFAVKTPQPPMASCSADPTTVQPGSPATITVTASSPDGRPLTYSYTATSGNASGTGNTATLSTAGVTPGSPVTVTANVVDDRNLSTSCTAMVNVLAPPVTVVEAQEVGACNFNDPRKTARVDNECKAVLDEVALRLQREPNGRLVVVGYAEDEEVAKVSNIDGQRAVNVKYYLTSGESQAQIDPSRIEARTGAHGSKSAKLYFVPEGASFSGEGTQTVDESTTKGRSRKAR
ncbi:outer membrane beta-barrel protein [Alloacidobacterium sp.]|uniref:outer membrane beta-barrel protein n=1 Tax=Alloacidobacterium sp. TaxID=2951999 RepID=UPI002D4D4FB6|nr:outer membrane beta-barrel protein [Alloacidobacterium sp.]HYK36581.1 outer membrane beta-barrel protein [Alloacidobacterium sp.]